MFNGRRDADKYVKDILKAYVGISGVVCTLAVSFGVWATLNINDLKTRITVIEASSFSASDANELLKFIQAELTAIRLEISNLPKEVPPQWFKEMVVNNTKDIRELQKKVK